MCCTLQSRWTCQHHCSHLNAIVCPLLATFARHHRHHCHHRRSPMRFQCGPAAVVIGRRRWRRWSGGGGRIPPHMASVSPSPAGSQLKRRGDPFYGFSDPAIHFSAPRNALRALRSAVESVLGALRATVSAAPRETPSTGRQRPWRNSVANVRLYRDRSSATRRSDRVF